MIRNAITKRYPLANEKLLHIFSGSDEGFKAGRGTVSAGYVTEFPNTPFKGCREGCGCVQGTCMELPAGELRSVIKTYDSPADMSGFSCLSVVSDVTRFAPGDQYWLVVRLHSDRGDFEGEAPILAECWNNTAFTIGDFEGAGSVRSIEIGVKNEGNVTVKAGELEDNLADLSDETFALEPGKTAEFTYTYKVTQADVDAGEIVNVVKANATAVRGDDPEEAEATAAVSTEKADPSISVEKSSDKDGDVASGDKITYTVVVKNTGNVTLSGVTVEDALMAEADAPAAFELAPNAEKTITYEYTVTDADDEAGLVTNTATATGNPPQNLDPVSDSDTEKTVVGKNDVNPTPDPGDEGEEMDAESKSVTVMYDGHPHTVSAEATRPGSTIYYSTDGGETWSEEAPSRTVVGETSFDIKATNPDYEDVVKTGYKIVVTKRAIILESATDEKVYDGTPLVRNEQSDVTISGDGLADTDALTFDITGSQTYVGSSDNTFTYEFSKKAGVLSRTLNAVKDYFTAFADEDSASIADNYDVTVIFGTLTVTDEGVDVDDVVTKTHKDKTYKVGETVTFTVEATNIYDEVKTITLSEIEGVTLAQSVFENVAPGETVTTTATYKLTKKDAKAGEFENVITASFSGDGKDFTNTDIVDDIQKPGSGSSSNPNTGDNGFGFDLTMMFGSAAAFLAMLFGRRRREQE